MLALVINNSGIVFGVGALGICFMLIAFWPEKYMPRGGFKVYDQEKDDQE